MEHDATSWSAEAIPSSPAISRALAEISVKWDDFIFSDIAFDCKS
jgi:hypothetical protein